MAGPLAISLNEFTAWLQSKGIAQSCPACGSSELAIFADDNGMAVAEGGSAGTAAFPECRTVCTNCGYVMAYSADVIAGVARVHDDV